MVQLTHFSFTFHNYKIDVVVLEDYFGAICLVFEPRYKYRAVARVRQGEQMPPSPLNFGPEVN